MFSQEKKRNSLNTIKINQLHKIICHFACDYLCATLVQLKEHQHDDTVQDGGGKGQIEQDCFTEMNSQFKTLY